jgi:quercetin dioxygenase-like cupin family protein
MYVEPNGVIGLHQTVGPQLFLFVRGKGWIRGRDERRAEIHAGQAVFWKSGEWHETGTEAGLVAIVIEGADLDPSALMPAVDLCHKDA